MNKILSIVWYKVLPADYGGQKGIAGFNDTLGKKVSLTCLCSRNNKTGEKLSYKVLNNLPVSRFQFWNPFVRKKILSVIRSQSFTDIIIEHPYHGWLGKYKKKYGFRFIVHAHNIEHLRMKANGKTWWRLIKRAEHNAFLDADYILFKTEKDKETAIGIFGVEPGKCIITPYGVTEQPPSLPDNEVKEKFRSKYNIADDEKILLFAGTLDYKPNGQAVDNILQFIIPLLEEKKIRFRVIVCGALPVKELARLNSIPHITATGFVESIHDYFHSADSFINPVVNGSGIQTKNIEAIAAGCNVVATDFAATGLPEYIINKKVFVSPGNNWKQFADNIVLASSQKINTPPQFYYDYNWQNIIDRLLPQIVKE